MTISKVKNDTELTVILEGRLDSVAALEFEAFMKDALDGVEHLIFDMDKLNYISSAGLRVLLSVSKKIKNSGGAMKLINVDDNVEDVLMVTGFRRAFTIETKGGRNFNPAVIGPFSYAELYREHN